MHCTVKKYLYKINVKKFLLSTRNKFYKTVSFFFVLLPHDECEKKEKETAFYPNVLSAGRSPAEIGRNMKLVKIFFQKAVYFAKKISK